MIENIPLNYFYFFILYKYIYFNMFILNQIYKSIKKIFFPILLKIKIKRKKKDFFKNLKINFIIQKKIFFLLLFYFQKLIYLLINLRFLGKSYLIKDKAGFYLIKFKNIS